MSERYKSKRLLGKGRAGEVHEAQDLVLDRKVAVRRFPDHHLSIENLSDEWKDTFLGIVGGLSRLSHSNLLRMIDGGIDADGPFLVTAYIEGKSLSELAYGDAFGEVDAYELAQQVIEALMVAEQEGFFHLALSPTSIIAQSLATGGYNYILTDLGHSKLLPLIYGTERALAMTQTPALLAPEVYEGKPAGVRTSQFILGHLIYWILAGSHPYDELTMDEAYQRHKERCMELLLDCGAGVPAEFTAWLQRLMQPDPADRFDTLKAALAGLPEPSRRLYAKKVMLPPKSISEEDFSEST